MIRNVRDYKMRIIDTNVGSLNLLIIRIVKCFAYEVTSVMRLLMTQTMENMWAFIHVKKEDLLILLTINCGKLSLFHLLSFFVLSSQSNA